MTLFRLLLFLHHFLVAFVYARDFTCLSSDPLIESSAPSHLFGVGRDQPPIKFERYSPNGELQELTDGNQTMLANDIERMEIPPGTGHHTDTRTGVFACTSSTNGSAQILVINHRKHSNVLPDGYVTKTASVGDTITLQVISRSNKIKWRHNGRKVLQWKGRASVTLFNVSTDDDGIYEAYTCLHKPHAYIRLIVRRCPLNFVGHQCNDYCVCYNGGVCTDEGKCICPPGFAGALCDGVRGPDCFGEDCQFSCSDQLLSKEGFEGSCGGELFCLPDPYGCSCYPGFHGLGCTEECEPGTFGADCLQTCHCSEGSTCDNQMGTCSPAICEEGWTGENCNERISCRHEPCLNGGTCETNFGFEGYNCNCPVGFIGSNCELIDSSACASAPCQNDGNCSVQLNGSYTCSCAIGYEGNQCEAEINECESQPCLNGGICTDLLGGFTCDCPEEVRGTFCEQINYCECQLWGNSHYHTFDGNFFTFQGDCEYVVSEHSHEDAALSGLPVYSLIVRQHKERPDDQVTRLSFLQFEFEGTIYKLQHGGLYVDGVQENTPYVVQGIEITLRSDNTYILTTYFGLVLQLDGHTLDLSLPFAYRNHVKGLCGDCDQNITNDCSGVGQEAVVCGRRWKASDSCEAARPFDGCLENEENNEEAARLCGIITDASGPFGDCSGRVDLESIERSCQYDLCSNLPDASLLCDHLEHLTSVCGKKEPFVQATNWRDYVPTCGYDCPSNTVYKSCGDALQETCSSTVRQGYGAVLPCVETCECDSGEVLANGDCIPRNECGCITGDGGYIENGESYQTSDCALRCLCNSGQLECAPISCDVNAVCISKNGVNQCYCADGYEGNGITCETEAFCSCSIWGGLHLLSFDGLKFDHYGECEYTLVSPHSIGISGYPNFELKGKIAKNSPLEAVSFMREVTLKYQGSTYQLKQDGVVLVNGERVRPPYSHNKGVYISQILGHTIFNTNFGLRVIWDNSQSVDVKLNRTIYFNNTKGLCGTCNDNPFDDFEMKDGVLTNDDLEFGASWKTGLDICFDATEEFFCPYGDAASTLARNLCNAIIDPMGLFQVCHDYVDPAIYYETCVYDVCSQESPAFLCSNMERYAQSCILAGVDISHWWIDRPECEPECDGGAIYVIQSEGCQKTCAFPEGDPNCEIEAMASCTCPEGQYLEGESCVNECTGCFLEDGQYIMSGDQAVNADCTEVCSCQDQLLECLPMSCSEFASCTLRSGMRDCFCDTGYEGNGQDCEIGGCSCSVWGGSHLNTFDGAVLSMSGECDYLLVTGKDTDAMYDYNIIVTNVKDFPSSNVSFARAVRLEVNGTRYEVLSGGILFVNGVQKPVPFQSGFATIYAIFPNRIVMDTIFGVSVMLQTPFTVEVKVSGDHFDKTEGLCGTCNGDVTDDFYTKTGVVTADAQQFRNAWIVDGETCNNAFEPTDCTTSSNEENEAIQMCNILTSATGPFSHCHEYVDPSPYFTSCVTDVCSTWTKANLLCNNLQTYAQICRQTGGSLPGDWRSQTDYCDSFCPSGLNYEACTSTCQPSCSETALPCLFNCEEMCGCSNEYVVDEATCVLREECGCVLPDGGYLQVGGEWINDDCSQICTCEDHSGLICIPLTCPSEANCEQRNGVTDCFCPPSYILNEDTCTKESCVCTVFGDPHFVTFDGVSFDYQGECKYILAENCGQSTEVPYFQIVGDHKMQIANDSVSYLKSIQLELLGKTYSLFVYGRVHVNGIFVNLPFSDGELTIRETSGGYVTLEALSGIRIRYDKNFSAEIELSNAFMGLTCGMCGTCSGKTDDELSLPNGNLATTLEEFGASYRVSNDCEISVASVNPCKFNSSQEIYARDVCHMLIRNPGPFSPCFDTANPMVYYNACVMDVCVTGKDSMLCPVLVNYGRICERMGISVSNWMEESPHCLEIDILELEYAEINNLSTGKRKKRATAYVECPKGADYISCDVTIGKRTTCGKPPLCDPQQPTMMCVCTAPMLLMNGECVPDESECYCESPIGGALKKDDLYISKNCEEKCWCDTNFERVCEEYNCPAHSHCENKGGRYGCYCDHQYSMTSTNKCERYRKRGYFTGDPHFTTFDGQKFDYMGDCQYVVTELCEDQSPLAYFKIIGGFSKTSPGSTVTWTDSIELIYDGSHYEIIAPDIIRLNGRDIFLPTMSTDPVYITELSDKFEIFTDFGLYIECYIGKYSSNFHYENVYVNLPQTYEGKVCGLLGDADGHTNDFPEANNGDKWETGSKCETPGDYDPCPVGSGAWTAASRLCQFDRLDEDCKDFVNQRETLLNGCIKDVCESNYDQEVVCQWLKAYANECRLRGGSPGTWWDDVPQCVEPCTDPKSEWTDCGSKCFPTCREQTVPSDCEDSTCEAGCRCKEGTYQENGKCVFRHQCGCSLEDGNYIQDGTSHMFEDCSTRCTCDLGESICETAGCQLNEECKVMAGKADCYCADGYKRRGTECTNEPCHTEIWGEVHVLTFDGQSFPYNGLCWFTLINTTGSQNLADFEIQGRILTSTDFNQLPILRGVLFIFNEDEFELKDQDPVFPEFPQLLVNGQQVPRHEDPTTSLTIKVDYALEVFVISTDWLDLRFHYKNHSLNVDLDYKYTNHLSGMCGSCNGNISDDLILPNENEPSSLSDFAKYWAQEDGIDCTLPEEVMAVSSLQHFNLSEAKDVCYEIIRRSGPYRDCLEVVDGHRYYNSCIYDYFFMKEPGIVGLHAGQYREACKYEGIDIEINENSIQCPSGMTYNPGSSSCQETCSNETYSKTCQGSCVCPEGMVLDKYRCVYRKDCGCDTPYGVYISVGEEYINNDCSVRCTCGKGSIMSCEPYQCHAEASCSVLSYRRACYCRDGYSGDGTVCELSGCECQLWTQSHFQTFDRIEFTMDTGCSYILLQSYQITGDLPAFRLIGRFGDADDTIHRLIGLRLEYIGLEYELTEDGTLSLDGDEMYVPYGDDHVSVSLLIDGKAIFSTDFGLTIMYDLSSMATITIAMEWLDMTAGLCGTCNNKQEDEFLMPYGSIANNVMEFGNSWLVDDGCTPNQKSIDPLVILSTEQEMLGKASCYIIGDPYGFFSPCHDYVNPKEHYDRCVSDYLIDPRYFCDAIESYATRCKARGGPRLNWRLTLTQCSMACPGGSNYNDCGEACNPSCVDPYGLTYCDIDCIETCTCPFGTLMMNTTCVRLHECPCFITDVGVINEGDSYVDPLCNSRYTCQEQTLLRDEDYSCGENALCTDRGNEHGCFCEDGYDGDGQICKKESNYRDCYEALVDGQTEDGIYTISPLDWPNGDLDVYCDMHTDGGGWVVFHKRVDGTENFDRDWEDYKNGFGHLNAEFWLGNEAIHYVSSQKIYSMRVDLLDTSGYSTYANYEVTSVGSMEQNYVLHWEDFTGTVIVNGLTSHNDMAFSTFDRDNDLSNGNCASQYPGGWWFNNCYYSNLNGDYGSGNYWMPVVAEESEMKLRPQGAS
ncbi:IgGFc-binding protein-like [Apostichopus japonicus]|uniref:IgGFc-binding protein-like n=1 Tax=Stichopus japonicus TaxID=307972 RepID=UPI003AB7D5B2